MKRIKLFLIVLLAGLALTLGACTKDVKDIVYGSISVTAPQGAPLIAIAGVSDDNAEISVVNGAAPLQAAFIGGTSDIVIAPVALGAKLYLKGALDYKLAAIITFNNTYLVTKNENNLTSLNDVKNEKILAYGQGTAPDAILQGALSKEDVTASIEYKTSVSDIAAPLLKGEYTYALLAEPVISNLKVKKGITLKTLLLTDLLSEEVSSFPQAAIFVKNNLTEEKENEVNMFLGEVKQAITIAKSNPESYASDIVGKYEYLSTSLGKDVIATCLPTLGLGYEEGNKARSIISAYATFVNSFNDKIIGGAPDSAFVRGR